MEQVELDTDVDFRVSLINTLLGILNGIKEISNREDKEDGSSED